VNGPNALSLLRIALTPFAVVLVARSSILAFPLIALALFTDFLDGWIARRCRASSTIGRFLDPLADKLFAAGVLAALAASGRVSWEIAVAVFVRDAALLVYGWMRLRGGESVPPANLPGKIAFAAFGGWLLALVGGVPLPVWAGVGVVTFYVLTGVLYGARVPWNAPGRVAKEPR
jgi:cardiolipin synthase